MKPHKWQKEIIALANGEPVQFLSMGVWTDIDPNEGWVFSANTQYRIKPEAPKWPVTRMSDAELMRCYQPISRDMGYASMRRLANAAIARACEDGDVITVEESRKRCATAICASQEGMVHESMLEKVAQEGVRQGRISSRLEGGVIVFDPVAISSIIASVKEGKE